MKPELKAAIKQNGLFVTVRRMQVERHAAMPQDISGWASTLGSNYAKSRSTAGTMLDKNNRRVPIKNSDPDVNRGKAFVGKPLPATADAIDDEPESELPTEDDATELLAPDPVIEAGVDDVEPEVATLVEDVDMGPESEEAAGVGAGDAEEAAV